MVNKLIKISNHDVLIKEFEGHRVVTFKDIDQCHERPEGTARKRFNDNRRHFIEGEDFFKACASEIRTNKIMDISSKVTEAVTFITESGYMMLVKSFTDDLAWQVQRQLVNKYFKSQATAEPYQTKSTSLGEVASFIKVMRSLMKDNNQPPEKIAEMAETVCKQFNVNIPDKLVKHDPFQLNFFLNANIYLPTTPDK